MAAKEVTFSLRLTDDELAAIETKAETLGLSRAALVRRLFERAGVLDPREPKVRPQPTSPARPLVHPNLKGQKLA